MEDSFYNFLGDYIDKKEEKEEEEDHSVWKTGC